MIVDSLQQLIGDTPMLRLGRVTAAHGVDVELLAKLELRNPYSLKDRPALAMIEEAEARGALAPGGTIVEASSGNAGIALTWIGRQRGYEVVICMSELMSDEHKRVLHALGARLELTPARDGIRGARARAQALARALPGAVYIEQHHNPANTRCHARTTGEEIWRDTAGRVDIFVHGLGSCGTLSGVARALKARKPEVRCVAFEPAEAPLISAGRFTAHRMLGVGPGFVPALYEPALVDELMTVSVDDAFAACRELATREGLLVGITSGGSVHAALQLARRPEHRGATIVVIFADGGKDYLSVDGLFPAPARLTAPEEQGA
ncbi:MAG: cysteine synthase family protein [Myxococcales bacterium]|nr:cysteine synthase family protein [Myxococcales bacterium]